MIRTFVACFTLLSLIFAYPSLAQEEGSPAKTTKGNSKPLPNLPGAFMLEFGFNQPFNKPDAFDVNFWGSRTFNVYYQYDLRISKSKFSVHPGIGLSLERYKLGNDYTLTLTSEGTSLTPASDSYPGVDKSMIVTNYIDVPIEIRFSTNPNDPGRSFRASIGGRAGYLYDSFTKIKYREDGETKKIKDKQNFNLNDFRYGAFVKIGAGNLSLFGYYNFSPLFKDDRGPDQTDMKNFTVGISLSSF